MTSYCLFCGDVELGKIECVNGVVSSIENFFSNDDAFTGIYGDIADAIRGGMESVSGTLVNDSRYFFLTWIQLEAEDRDDTPEPDDQISKTMNIKVGDA